MARIPRPVSRLLSRDADLNHLQRMVERQQALLREVRALLPDPLAAHCLHARIRGSELVLHVDSPAWNSRLRFQAPALLRALRSRAPALRRVRVRVLPPAAATGTAPPPARGTRRRHIPLHRIADPELRALLEK